MLCPYLVIHFSLFHTALRTLGGGNYVTKQDRGLVSACKSLAFVWSRLGEVKSWSCESSRLNSRKFSKIRVSCLSHRFVPKFRSVSSAGKRGWWPCSFATPEQRSRVVFQDCFARMRGCDKGRSLLRGLHMSSSSKCQVMRNCLRLPLVR